MAVITTIPICNCDWPYAQQCPGKWDNLEEQAGSKASRICPACLKSVTLFESIEKMKQANIEHKPAAYVWTRDDPNAIMNVDFFDD